ncbi:MAG: hypothetical protein O3B01_21365 [Planctomycetota bacterium]|nr:hypothetical protein [Planctomycetota bacterium]
MMTPEQRYLFDVYGYLHLENVFGGADLKAAQDAADRYVNTPVVDLPPGFGVDGRRYLHGFAFDPSLEALAIHPAVWPIIMELTGGKPRLVSGTLQLSFAGSEVEAYRMHCAREDNGPKRNIFEKREGKIYASNFVIFPYLTDVYPGDGGLVVVPGSHKSEFERPLSLFNNGTMLGLDKAPDGVLNITPKAGDMVVMTESLVHGILAWKPKDRYRAILGLRYHPQDSDIGSIPEEIKQRLSPEVRELIEVAPQSHSKSIARI